MHWRARLHSPLSWRNDRQQKPGLSLLGDVQSVLPAKDCGRTVLGVAMDKRPDASQWVWDMRRDDGWAAVFIILSTNCKGDSISGRHDNAGWPDLDVEFDRHARGERPNLIVSMIGAIRQTAFGVELPVRSAQPPLPDRCVRILGALEYHLVPIGREDTQDQE